MSAGRAVTRAFGQPDGSVFENILNMGINSQTAVPMTVAAETSNTIDKMQSDAENKLKSLEAPAKPPTMEDAKAKADMGAWKPRTYGRAGTIMNQGGARGIASSLLNLSSPTLLGK